MKTIVGITIGIFIIFMSYVFVGGYIQKNAFESNGVTPATTPRSTNRAKQSYTTSNVALYSTVDDCWLIINNNVYDVSTFLGQHPGGASTITPYCGKEATKAFDTQDRGSDGRHSNSATSMLADYLIGTISQ